MFPQISRTPDFEQRFLEKRCGLSAGVYGSCFSVTLYISMEAKFDSLAKLAGWDFSLPLIFVLVFVLF